MDMLMPTPVVPVETPAPVFEVRYMSLFLPGRGVAFPCDAKGAVNHAYTAASTIICTRCCPFHSSSANR